MYEGEWISEVMIQPVHTSEACRLKGRRPESTCLSAWSSSGLGGQAVMGCLKIHPQNPPLDPGSRVCWVRGNRCPSQCLTRHSSHECCRIMTRHREL